MKKTTFFLLFFTVLLLLTSCTNEGTHNQEKKSIQTGKLETTSFLRAHFIDVGQADATLLQFKNQDELLNVLIDTGDWNRNEVIQYLHKENIQDIDLIVITHPHADHIGQLYKIIGAFDVGEVWMNGDISNAQVFANALQTIENHGVDYYEPTIGETFDIGDATFEVIHPGDLSLGTNDNSISMRIEYGDISFLFTGDAERAAEEKMLTSGANLKADILHLGHHGSNTSSTENFLAAVNAEIAIYSAGVGNSYGHPNVDIIERIQARNMAVYGTDQEGTIIIETDGKKYQALSQNKDSLPPPLLAKNCLNINTASAEDLQQLIHVGEKLASEIIHTRPYASLDELINVKGIGDSRLADIQAQNLACIGG